VARGAPSTPLTLTLSLTLTLTLTLTRTRTLTLTLTLILTLTPTLTSLILTQRRARHVIARWRRRELTLVFGAWRGEVQAGRHVWERARSAGARLLQRRLARAFSAWDVARRARTLALGQLGAPSRR